MAKLKLFISHSSRLDDVPNKWTSLDRNWKLLEDTCAAIKNKYGDRVDVLVDRDGLVPGEDWNHQLNLWLSECQAAIIIFSERSRKKSDWVAKEATILSWRADLDEDMTLIPVTLKHETKPEQLAEGFWGTLQIDKHQCIRNVESADDIIQGFESRFEPETLANLYPSTPFEKLQNGIAERLSKDTTLDSIIDSLTGLGCPIPEIGAKKKEKYSAMLAREFLNPGRNINCCNVFQIGLDTLTPEPAKDKANYLYKIIRSLWVEANAAAHLPLSLEKEYPLLMVGDFVDYKDEELGTMWYTLERVIERAWHGSSLYRIIPVTEFSNGDSIKTAIRNMFFPSAPDSMLPETQDTVINNNPNKLILFIKLTEDHGGLPDHRKIVEIKKLYKTYGNLVIIFSIMSLPNSKFTLELVRPTEKYQDEQLAYGYEIIAKKYLNQKYPE